MKQSSDSAPFVPEVNDVTYTASFADRAMLDIGSDKIVSDLEWSGAIWGKTPIMGVNQFLPESSNHRPVTQLKLQYDQRGIFGLFRVEDRYVRCVQTNFQDMVCNDSCVEIFLQPHPELLPEGRVHPGYINLEISGNGTLLSYHIRDAERAEGGFKDFEKLTLADGNRILTRSTLPKTVYPEIQEPLEWRLAFHLPFKVIEKYLGPLWDSAIAVSGQRWRMNAFKCSEDSSHPHWASWQPCSSFNFHKPSDFGYLLFE